MDPHHFIFLHKIRDLFHVTIDSLLELSATFAMVIEIHSAAILDQYYAFALGTVR